MGGDVKEAEHLAIESLKNFEIRPGESISGSGKKKHDEIYTSNKNEEENQSAYIENKTTRKISTVLEFLAEIYDLKKE